MAAAGWTRRCPCDVEAGSVGEEGRRGGEGMESATVREATRGMVAGKGEKGRCERCENRVPSGSLGAKWKEMNA